MAAATKTPAHGAIRLSANATTDCAPIYSVGHKTNGNENWSYQGSDSQVYFYSSGPRTSFCWQSVGELPNGYITGWVVSDTNGWCLTVNTANQHIYTTTPCSQTNPYQIWFTVHVGGSSQPYVVAFDNDGETVGNDFACMYEDTQEPAIYTSCSAQWSDNFLWFYWPITG
jgi:hypothetical protein